MHALRTPLAALAAVALASCSPQGRAQRHLEHGWIAFGTVGTVSELAHDAATTPEHVAEYVDSGRRVVLTGRVEQVCRTMGCWLDVTGPSGTTVRVMTRDHSYFIPRNAAGRKVQVVGYATVREQSVEMLKHLASDAGASQAEIDAIVAPSRSLLFVADAVILPPEGLEAPMPSPAPESAHGETEATEPAPAATTSPTEGSGT